MPIDAQVMHCMQYCTHFCSFLLYTMHCIIQQCVQVATECTRGLHGAKTVLLARCKSSAACTVQKRCCCTAPEYVWSAVEFIVVYETGVSTLHIHHINTATEDGVPTSNCCSRILPIRVSCAGIDVLPGNDSTTHKSQLEFELEEDR